MEPPVTSHETEPYVTVVIPCFNREDTVREAVQSVLDQDYPSFDVIAVDDNSTDRTLAILNSISDPRLSVVTNPGKGGPCTTRNFGVAQSNSPWIAFQDSDDLWLPGKLSRQMAVIGASETVAVYCAMVVKNDTNPDSPVLSRYPGPEITHRKGDILPSLIYSSFISTQTAIVRRDVFDAVQGFDEDFPALVDWELMLRVAQKGNVAFIDEDLVIQRLSGNSITRAPIKRLTAQKMILEKHSDLLASYPGAKSFHHARVAGALRQNGDFSGAAEQAMMAWRSGKNPKHLAVSMFNSLRGYVSNPAKNEA